MTKSPPTQNDRRSGPKPRIVFAPHLCQPERLHTRDEGDVKQEHEDERPKDQHQVSDEHQRAKATGVGPVPGARRGAVSSVSRPFLLKPAQLPLSLSFDDEFFGERCGWPQIDPSFATKK